MTIVNIYQAKTHLSRLLEQAAAGEEIVIARAGKPIAKLVPVGSMRRTLGGLEGSGSVPPDFDAPLPDDVLEAFER